MRPFSLYIHIPFCLHKCPYCDFNTYAVPKVPERDYVAALLVELDSRAALPEWKGRMLQTIYFGGGTPSLFSAESIHRLVGFAKKLFKAAPDIEISLEANPGTLSLETLRSFRDAGINRISLGAQTFDPGLLKTLGRIHSPEQTESAVADARSAGFENISIDLIFGLPGQTIELLQIDLEKAMALSPNHISAYGLTIEKGTPFFESYKKGTIVLPPEDTIVEMMELVSQHFAEHGLLRYEISNYAHPGFEARHNLAYWNGDDYLGLGAGAHSFLLYEDGKRRNMGRRWSNYALPQKYIDEAVAQGVAESWKDRLTIDDLMFEYFFLGLRKIEGVSLSKFKTAFRQTVEETYPSILEILRHEALVQENDDYLSLTEKGLLLADSVIENFVDPKVMQKRSLKHLGLFAESKRDEIEVNKITRVTNIS